MKRNYAIDWIKGFMILIVVLVHTCQIEVLRHGYIVVDMFFLLSGYFLFCGFEKHPTTAVSYTWGRVKKFFLPYILCFALSCLLRIKGLTSFTDFGSFMERYSKFAFYLTLTEEIGPKILTEHIILGSWFLSVLIIAGFLLYSILEYNKDLAIKVLLPLSCVAGYTFIFTYTDSIMNWSRVGAVSIPLLRGFCGMASGVLLASLMKDYRESIQRRSTLVNIAGILSFILFVAIMFTEEPYDVCLLVTVPWIVLSALIDKSWLNSLLARWGQGRGPLSVAGRNTIYILFAHPPVVMVVNYTNDILLGQRLSPLVVVLITLLLTFAATVILKAVCKFIDRKWLHSQVTP